LDDEVRDRWLTARGYSYRVLRFWNHEVLTAIALEGEAGADKGMDS
jgi:very-short-patch-repair endonuclease